MLQNTSPCAEAQMVRVRQNVLNEVFKINSYCYLQIRRIKHNFLKIFLR